MGIDPAGKRLTSKAHNNSFKISATKFKPFFGLRCIEYAVQSSTLRIELFYLYQQPSLSPPAAIQENHSILIPETLDFERVWWCHLAFQLFLRFL
jgi:hypothetical protein